MQQRNCDCYPKFIPLGLSESPKDSFGEFLWTIGATSDQLQWRWHYKDTTSGNPHFLPARSLRAGRTYLPICRLQAIVAFISGGPAFNNDYRFVNNPVS